MVPRVSNDGQNTRESAKLLESWTLLTAQSEAFGRSIMTDLSPEVRELMDLFSGFVRSHSDEWLANIKTGADQLTVSIKSINWKKIGEQIKVWWDYIKAIDWAKVSQEIKSFGQAADGAAQFVGGWAKAVELLFALWVGAKFLAASIAAYNAGAGRVSSLQKQYGGQWLSHAPPRNAELCGQHRESSGAGERNATNKHDDKQQYGE